MSRLTCIFLLASTLLSEGYSQNPWRILARPTIHDLNKLHFLDSLRGWVMGDSGVILKTTNGGQNWIMQNSGTTNNIMDVFMINDRLGWAVAHLYPQDTSIIFGTIILKSTNGGNAWESEMYRDEFFNVVYFQDSLNGWMGGAYGTLVWTTDAGGTWALANIDSSMFTGFPILNIKFQTPQYGFAPGGFLDLAGTMVKTTNFGESWAAIPVGPEPVHDIYFVDSTLIYCVSGDLDFGSGLITTTDRGETWEYRYLEIWGEARALTFRTRSEAWSPLGFPGTYMYTLDSGRTWTSIYTPDSSGMFDAIFTDSLTGYMVGQYGTILKYTPAPSSVPPERIAGLPSSTRLYQNFPNPFNPATIIEYEIADHSLVTIVVYDLAGREVQTAYKGFQLAGKHRLTFRGDGLPSGIYFCRIVTRSLRDGKGETDVRKMVLLR